MTNDRSVRNVQIHTCFPPVEQHAGTTWGQDNVQEPHSAIRKVKVEQMEQEGDASHGEERDNR